MVTMACHIKSGQVDRISDLYDLAAKLGVQELSIWEGIPKTPEEKLTMIEREKIIGLYRKINSAPGGPRGHTKSGPGWARVRRESFPWPDWPGSCYRGYRSTCGSRCPAASPGLIARVEKWGAWPCSTGAETDWPLA